MKFLYSVKGCAGTEIRQGLEIFGMKDEIGTNQQN